VTEALWALIGVLVGTFGTGLFNLHAQRRQFEHNKEMFLLQNRSAEVVKQLLSDMLNHKTNIDRSFSALRTPIGGFTDDQIRVFLHDIGAKKVPRDDGAEWWYLLARQEERLARKQAAA